ncbi:hypothetical protein D3C80_1853180 [compost metagenome]
MVLSSLREFKVTCTVLAGKSQDKTVTSTVVLAISPFMEPVCQSEGKAGRTSISPVFENTNASLTAATVPKEVSEQ